MSENENIVLGNEWSPRHVRLRNQAFIFSLVFCIFCLFKVDIKLPFVSFQANTSLPKDWVVRSILLFLSMWTIISLIMQTLREERQVGTEEDLLKTAIQNLNSLRDSLSIKLDEFDRLPGLNSNPNHQAVKDITTLVSQEIERLKDGYAQQAEEISVVKPWIDSLDKLEEVVLNGLLKEHPEGNKMYFIDNLNSLKETFEARASDLLQRTYSQSELQTLVGSVAENKDFWLQIDSNHESFRKSFPKFVKEMNDKGQNLEVALVKHRNAIGNARKTVNRFDKTFAPWVPVCVSSVLVVVGIFGWNGTLNTAVIAKPGKVVSETPAKKIIVEHSIKVEESTSFDDEKDKPE